MRFMATTVRVVMAAAVVGLVLPSTGLSQAEKPKQAQKSQKAAATEPEVEEITVTAQKREEPLQETPISITALTSEAIEEKGIQDVLDLNTIAPNLHMHPNSGGASGVTVNMRGAITSDPIITLQPTTGLYLDGVYIAKSGGANLDLTDLDRIEVLRGPQGTLWGRNTTGGAINFILKKPTDERSITLKTEAGNYDQFTGAVIANVPLNGKNGLTALEGLGQIDLRQTVEYRSREGFYLNTGSTGPADFMNLARISTNTALRWEPTEDITIDYNLQYHRHRENPSASQLTYIYPGSPVSAGPFDLTSYVRGDRVSAIKNNALLDNSANPNNLSPQANHGNGRVHGLTAEFNLGELGPLGDVTLKSISAYRSFFTQEDQDLDGSDLHVADFHLNDNVQHWSQEVQFIGTVPRVKYVLGGYYYGEHGDEHSQQVFFAGGTNLGYMDRFNSYSLAPYGQATWTPPVLNDKLSLTAGIRYSQEQVHHEKAFTCFAIIGATGGNLCNIGIPAPALNNFSASNGKAFGGTDAISPMGNVAYQWTDDLMTYVKGSRGFKSGGFNGRATDAASFAEFFTPEVITTVEGGFKSQWLDNRLRANASLFYSHYKDLQVAVFRASKTGGAVSTLQNAASADIWGTEFEMVALPVRGLETSLAYGFIDPTYNEFLEQARDPLTGNPIPGATVDVADQRKFVDTPKHTITLGATYTAPPTETGTFSAHIETYWQDSVVFLVTPDNNDQGNYTLVNGRMQLAGIPLMKGSLDVALFAHNLLDRKYRAFGVDFGPQLGFAVNQYGDPRTFGLQMTYNFTVS